MHQPGPGRHPAVRGLSSLRPAPRLPAGTGRAGGHGYDRAMADASETAASLRVARVTALSSEDRLHLLTYLLAKYPDSFSEMLDDALSAVSPGRAGGKDEA